MIYTDPELREMPIWELVELYGETCDYSFHSQFKTEYSNHVERILHDRLKPLEEMEKGNK